MSGKAKKIDQFEKQRKSPTENQLLQSGVQAGRSNKGNDSRTNLAGKQASERFKSDNEGLWHRTNSQCAWQWIASQISCIALLRDGNTGECYGRRLQLVDAEGQERSLDIPIEWFSGDARRVEEVLLKANFHHDRKRSSIHALLQYLVLVPPPKESLAVYDKTGWSGACFILPHRSMGGRAGCFVGDKDVGRYESFGELRAWQRAAKMCQSNSRLHLALLTAFAAPLLEIVGIDNFGIHFAGPSSIGKTSALKVAASVFGNPDRYLLTWRATSNALEGVATSHNDTLLILDEIGQASNDLNDTVYMLFNGQGKSRLKRDCGLRKATAWRLILLSSGETTLEEHIEALGKKSKAGQEVRCITITADAEKGLGILDDLQGAKDSGSFIQSILEKLSEGYGIAGETFIEELCKRRSQLKQEARPRIQKIRDELLAEIKSPAGQARRVAEKISLLAYAGELAIEYEILPFEKSAPLEICKQICSEWVEARGGGGELESKKIIEHLQVQIETHPEKFISATDHYPKESWGYKRGGIYYLTVGGLKLLFTGFGASYVKSVLLKTGIIRNKGAEVKTIYSESARVFELHLEAISGKT